jgi:hypothetical protein
MSLVKRGEWWYGTSQADIRAELLRYSQGVGYPTQHFADAVCVCGDRTFHLHLDENEGVAVRACAACGNEHPMGDSAEYLAEAELEECECLCGGSDFEVTAGVSLYEDSEDVKWLYIGCRCPICGLTACLGDWKNQAEGYRTLLDQI